jgi:hypothetical protein
MKHFRHKIWRESPTWKLRGVCVCVCVCVWKDNIKRILNKYGKTSATARSKAYVCGRLVAGVAGSNPAEGIDVCLLCLCVVLSCAGRDLCDGPITRPEESYRMCQL